MFPPSTRSSVPCVLSPRAHGPGPEAPLVAPHARPGGTTTAKVPDAGARGIPRGSRASLGMRVQRGASQGDHLCVPTAAWQVWAHVWAPCPGDHKQLSSLSVAGVGAGGGCTEMCPTWDVSFSRIPAKGWQAQKGRGWHAPRAPPSCPPRQTPV